MLPAVRFAASLGWASLGCASRNAARVVLGAQRAVAAAAVTRTAAVRHLSSEALLEYAPFKPDGSDSNYHGTYLDVQATTQLDPRVLDAMMPFMTFRYGNPHSQSHSMGQSASRAVEVSRMNVANLIGASPQEIIFTSGATESNNLAIKGVTSFLAQGDLQHNHIVTSSVEHKCVMEAARTLADQRGCPVTFLPVDSNGRVDPEDVRESITDRTAIVSVMFVNNEVGTVQPIKEIGEICKEKGVLFHVDAAQAVGKLPIDVEEMHIDLMSISGHKLYGPKGVGGLYVRRQAPRVRLLPLFSGGGQERGLRSGTLAPAQCVGLGEACRIAGEEMQFDDAHVRNLARILLSTVGGESFGTTEAAHLSGEFTGTEGDEQGFLPYIRLNGSAENRYWGNVNMSFEFVEGESLLLKLNEYMLSSGSACTSESLEPSYVLHAMGVSDAVAHTSIRFGMGRFTTEEDVRGVGEALCEHVRALRAMSPLYEMQVIEGIDLSTIEWTE